MNLIPRKAPTLSVLINPHARSDVGRKCAWKTRFFRCVHLEKGVYTVYCQRLQTSEQTFTPGVNMAKLGMTKAAKLAGVSRTTLYKKIKNGDISATKNADGHNEIDVAELERVYGPLNGVDAQGNVQVDKGGRSGNTSSDTRTTLLEQEISFQKREIESLKAQLEEAKVDKAAWMKQAEATQRLLTAGSEDRKSARRWWQFGRSE